MKHCIFGGEKFELVSIMDNPVKVDIKHKIYEFKDRVILIIEDFTPVIPLLIERFDTTKEACIYVRDLDEPQEPI